MRAMIRRDEGAAAVVDPLIRDARALSAAAGRVSGFIVHTILQTDDGALISVSICEDQVGLTELDQLFTTWLVGQAAVSARPAPRVISGDVILQKGL